MTAKTNRNARKKKSLQLDGDTGGSILIAGKSPELLTVEEAAIRARVDPAPVWRKIHAGIIPAVQLGGKYSPLRIRANEFEAWISRPVTTDKETRT
jgi:excisionase family DNA binding protein